MDNVISEPTPAAPATHYLSLDDYQAESFRLPFQGKEYWVLRGVDPTRNDEITTLAIPYSAERREEVLSLKANRAVMEVKAIGGTIDFAASYIVSKSVIECAPEFSIHNPTDFTGRLKEFIDAGRAFRLENESRTVRIPNAYAKGYRENDLLTARVVDLGEKGLLFWPHQTLRETLVLFVAAAKESFSLAPLGLRIPPKQGLISGLDPEIEKMTAYGASVYRRTPPMLLHAQVIGGPLAGRLVAVSLKLQDVETIKRLNASFGQKLAQTVAPSSLPASTTPHATGQIPNFGSQKAAVAHLNRIYYGADRSEDWRQRKKMNKEAKRAASQSPADIRFPQGMVLEVTGMKNTGLTAPTLTGQGRISIYSADNITLG
jgi:hypothetical protein